MQKHVNILGWLYIIYHALGIVVGFGIFVLVAGAGIISGEVVAVGVLTLIGFFISLILIGLSLPGIIAGFGILGRKPWARILALILAAFHMFEFPFGTVFGVYAFWVLMNPEVQPDFV